MGLSSLLDIGRKGLNAAQTSIEVTGNNISNVDTEGYSRRSVQLKESTPINFSPGQLGTGVDATEVLRSFDKFIERGFLDKSSLESRYNSLSENLKSIDSLFNESTTDGVSSALSTFFSNWQKLSQQPDDYSSRETLVSSTNSLTNVLQLTDEQMGRYQEQTNQAIAQDVDRVNQILDQVSQLNKQIAETEIKGVNNPNSLYDTRDKLLRELATKMDVNVIDNGGSKLTITTSSGYTLVDGIKNYSLSYDAPKVMNDLTAGSPFDKQGGKLYFQGKDDYEYTLEVVNGGSVDSGTTTFRVSLDGGQSWLKNDDGSEMNLPCNSSTGLVEVRGVKIWFGDQSDPNAAPPAGATLSTGDRFEVVPKTGVYWHEDTSTVENITPQTLANGQDNTRRLTGGSLAGLCEFRDNAIGGYRDKLDTLCEELIWNVNVLHSQGAGLDYMTTASGTYGAFDSTVPLSNATSGNFYRDRLTSGSIRFYMYDSSNKLLNNIGYSLDFDGAAAGQQNFDPSVNSLTDVRDALNRAVDQAYTDAGLATPTTPYASIVNGKLQIQSQDNMTFGFGQDTTGLLAALGINTYFQGTNAASISVNDAINANRGLICAGHINGAGEANSGDNTTAQGIGDLSTKALDITTATEGTVHQSLSDYYANLVTNVGADASSAQFNYKYQSTLASDLDNRQQAVSGVNLDEELANLIKYQHSYSAAAKLVTTADEMIQVLLSMKQ